MQSSVTMIRAAAIAAVGVAVTAAGCGSDGGSGTQQASTAKQDTGSQVATPARGRTAAPAARGMRLSRIGNFSAPIYVTSPPNDSRLFVVERAGRILVVKNRHVITRPFLDISSDVRTDGERGLLSMAFAPDYAKSGLFYVYFTDRSGNIHVQEFHASGDVADRGSRRNVITIAHSQFSNHNGGQLQFGPDRLLYIGVGDGGSEGDPFRNGQKLSTPLAKLLRINPSGRPYSIPASNPFRNRAGARPEIYAYGLRNAWRFSFDRKTGDLVIGDVGQDTQEEVDFAPRGKGAGANYGWSVFEGRLRYNSGSAPGAVPPVLVHSHSSGWCSIIGGYVVRDTSLRGVYGRYVYGDLCRPGIRSVVLRRGSARGDRALGVSVSNLVSFGQDAAGHVYAVSLDGPVYRLVPR